MKKLFICIGLTIISFISFSQPNNPYNQKGIDYMTSVNMIRNDYNAGKARDFNEETLKYYSKLIPLENKVSVDVASEIIRLRNNGNFDFNSFLANSSLSEISRQTFTQIVLNPNRLAGAAYKSEITEKADMIKTSNIPANEKELVLSLIAISYNIQDNLPGSVAALIRGHNWHCFLSGPGGSGEGSNAQCIIAGALIGGIIGWEICGFWCALGGAVIGGVAGALS